MERFDLLQKLNQKSVIERVKCIHNGLISEPIVIDFDCSTRCNLECYFCISKDIVECNAFSYDELIMWSQVMKEMNVKAVILTGGGEPLTNPYIDDFILSLKNNSAMQIGLVTNGTLINQHDSLEECSWMRVSLDAGFAQTFEMMKGKKFFDSIINNLANFNSRKGKCETGVSFLISHDADKGISNIEEIYTAASLSKEIKCNYFELKLQFDMQHFDIDFDQEKINEIKQQVIKTLKLQDEKFHVYLNHNISTLFLDKKRENERDLKLCHICNLRTVISPNGLYVCSYHRGNKRFKYGESVPEKFKEYWNSNERQELIRSIVFSEDCAFNCARKQSNSRIQSVLNELNEGIFCEKEMEDTDLFI